MKYYLECSSWNLLESFSTESISPYAFYRERDFGNNLSRYLSGENEKSNYLILSNRDRGGDITIEVDEQIIDLSLVKQINKRTKMFTYPKTIYYKKGGVRFRFNSYEIKENLVSESKILLEIKTLEKYSSDFYVRKVMAVSIKDVINLSDSMSFNIKEYINYDNIYNKIKGGIFGYVRGRLTSQDSSIIQLQNKLRELKNTYGGLYTKIMTEEKYQEDTNIQRLLEECKEDYLHNIGHTNSFDVINAQYEELNQIAIKRTIETSSTTKEKLLTQHKELIFQLEEIEELSNIKEYKRELQKIRNVEKENGKKNEKTREYFKKGSVEYERKEQLKRIINEIENDEKYIQLRNELNRLENELESNSNKYDTLLSAIFTRIGDILNDLIRIVSQKNNCQNPDLAEITKNDNGSIQLIEQEEPERIYFNILLNEILRNPSKDISEYTLLQLIEKSAIIFKNNKLSKSEKGIRILDTLRAYWAYKSHKTESFSIPEQLPLLQSIMSFLIKSIDYSQIERFMIMKNYAQKSYAFMLWGAWVGFADMPKTFTNVIFQNEEATKLLEKII